MQPDCVGVGVTVATEQSKSPHEQDVEFIYLHPDGGTLHATGPHEGDIGGGGIVFETQRLF